MKLANDSSESSVCQRLIKRYEVTVAMPGDNAANVEGPAGDGGGTDSQQAADQ